MLCCMYITEIYIHSLINPSSKNNNNENNWTKFTGKNIIFEKYGTN